MEGDQILRIGKEAVLNFGGDRMGTREPSAVSSGCDSTMAGAGVGALKSLETQPWDIDDAFGPKS